MIKCILLPLLFVPFQYPAESLISAIPKEQLGLLIIALYIALFAVLIFVMLRLGHAKRR